MQVELNSDGTRNTQFRPRILLEDTTYNNVLYDPHQSYNHGLYDPTPQYHQSWSSHVNNFIDTKLTKGSQVPKVVPANPNNQPFAMGTSRSGDRNAYRRLFAT